MSRPPAPGFDEILLEAASRERDDREAYLCGLATVDRDLVDLVRRRLQAAESLPSEFLSSPATEWLRQAFAEEDPSADPAAEPAPVGDDRFEILECLGRGGMASVYRAFDHRLARPVALKLLHTTDAETPERLLREARAQARVRHDHVLEVYDTGSFEGRPYVALRYVAGGTLADLEAARDGTVGLEEKVRLVAQAAEGLHAAHRQGLLHGDVKPSNVFVEASEDGDLQAWIGDFGIATELAPSSRGPLAGTPGYMAPELQGARPSRPDRRSDVYSLGATLFVALTGSLPQVPVSRSALQRQAPSLPADLVAVVARCLAADMADRYPSARAVAADLLRFLDGDVVQAYADQLSYRLSRFAVRHRALLTLGAVSALLLLVALAVAAILGVRAIRANAVADQRRGQAEELIRYTLLDLRDKLDAVGRLELLDEVGRRAMRYFAAVPVAELTDDELGHRATALNQIGDVRMRRGDLEGAEQAFAESLALARGLSERRPDDLDRLFDVGQSEFWMGLALFRRERFGGAREHFDVYLDIARRLVAAAPERRDWQQELSYAHSNLGSVLRRQGDLHAALERFRAALAIDRHLLDTSREAEQDERRFELAASHNTTGEVLEELGRLDEAQSEYEADLALRLVLARRDPQNRRWQSFLGTSHEFVGMVRMARGDFDAARSRLRSAHQLFSDLVMHEPENGEWRHRLALNLLQTGFADLAAGEPAAGDRAAAASSLREADRLAAELAAAGPDRVAWQRLYAETSYYLALLAAARPGDEATARRQLDRALGILETVAAPTDRITSTALARCLLLDGDLHRRAGAPDAARRAFTRAAEVVRPWLSADGGHHKTLAVWQVIAERLGDHAGAEEARRRLEAMGVHPAGTFPDIARHADRDPARLHSARDRVSS